MGTPSPRTWIITKGRESRVTIGIRLELALMNTLFLSETPHDRTHHQVYSQDQAQYKSMRIQLLILGAAQQEVRATHSVFFLEDKGLGPQESYQYLGATG